MVNGLQKARAIVLCVCALAAVFLLVRSNHPRRRHQSGDPIGGFQGTQLDVLAQDAAYPGKHLHAAVKGVDIVNYTCTAQDSAYAIFTVRDKLSGAEVSAGVESAKDPEGNSYVVDLMTSQVSLLVLKAGFAKIPSMVTVTLSSGPSEPQGQRLAIHFSRMAAPRRFLTSPSASEAAAAGKLATATLDEQTGDLRVVSLANQVPDTTVVPTVLGATFVADGQGDSLLRTCFFPDTYATGLQAAKVRLDHYAMIEGETTLTYHNAKVVEANGQPFLSLPTTQKVGSILDYDAYLSNRIPNPRATPSEGSHAAPVYIRLSSQDQRVKKRTRLRSFNWKRPKLSLIDITPSPLSLGLSSLQIVFANAYLVGAPQEQKVIGDDQAFAKPRYPILIPEFKIRIRTEVPKIMSSETVILPVQHLHLGRTIRPKFPGGVPPPVLPE